MKKVLTIAGFDPSGWAGVQADVRTFEAFSAMGLSVITSLTAQNRKSVKAKLTVPPAFVKKEMTAILEEFAPDAVKIGMLGSVGNVKMLTRLIRESALYNIVLDPVIRSTSGHPLLEKRGVKALKDMLPLVTVVTPNVPEASMISGVRIKKLKDVEAAAERIFALGPANVLIKGGHLTGDPVDVLYDGSVFKYYEGKRIRAGREILHGTGCVLSSAIAAGLARERPIGKAVADARTYLIKTILRRLKEV
jgi:hydroxymethylpyrimidine/phosphomethylpyrimidine kinase